ncbi:FHA domain-containing protein [Gryllotalpicola ginsengisoli]|uniref:FHA domain-containing protein n=1 Tax=Gryllotalpicola ginsengisoli TaxID=444608 RepID=UPI0003B37885|nr:FHA domain-containing protein [Gryllotalpicola ginsengisoli]
MLKVRATAPGGWLVIAVPGVGLMLESPAETPWDVEALMAALRSPQRIPETLGLLTARGFAAMPAFALVALTASGTAHYVVRGTVTVELQTADGPRSADGSGISTWRELAADDVSAFRVAPAGAGGGGPLLPLAEGAAWGDLVEFHMPGTAAGASTDASAASTPTAAAPPATEAAPATAPAASGARAAAAPAAAPGPAAAPAPGASVPAAPAPASAREPELTPAPEAMTDASHDTMLPPELEATTVVPHVPAGPRADAPAASAPAPTSPTRIQPPPAADAPPTDSDTYDHLFGATIMKSVETAAVRPAEEDEEDADKTAAPPPEPSAEPQAGDAGDHDGMTMMSGDIAELRRRAAAGASHHDAADEPSHGRPAEPQFRLEFADGAVEELDRPVIVGRAPSASKVAGNQVPRLLTVGAGDPDISRSHVRFTVEGGTVVITDLNSRNGTLMTLPGRPAQRLRGGEPASALAGTVVDLGGGIVITVTDAGSAAGTR